MEPAYRRSRREAIVAGIIFVVAATWTVTACYLLGYGKPVRSIRGVPHWVLWGIFLPWAVFFVVNCWFSLFYIRDDDSLAADAHESREQDPPSG